MYQHVVRLLWYDPSFCEIEETKVIVREILMQLLQRSFIGKSFDSIGDSTVLRQHLQYNLNVELSNVPSFLGIEHSHLATFCLN
jgi:hypothetical protein